MAREGFHEGFFIEEKQIDVDNGLRIHQHNYFQILYISTGKGIHRINDVDIPYTRQSIFLIAPGDTHVLKPTETTNYSSYKFTEILFSSISQLPDRKYWLQQIEHILHHPNIMPSDCIADEDDRQRLWRIHDLILQEYKSKNEFYWSIITNGITTSLSIIARSIMKKYTAAGCSSTSLSLKKTDLILSYIRENVYEPELIKIEHLADHFNMSEANIATLFKKETGESIRQYIINYKLMLVKYRLVNTNYSISEIAYELGFTDESHLTKAFKSRFELSPKQYRNKLLQEKEKRSAQEKPTQ